MIDLAGIFNLVVVLMMIVFTLVIFIKWRDNVVEYSLSSLSVELKPSKKGELKGVLSYVSFLEKNKKTFLLQTFRQGQILKYKGNNYIITACFLKKSKFKPNKFVIYLKPYSNDQYGAALNNYSSKKGQMFVDDSEDYENNEASFMLVHVRRVDSSLKNFIRSNSLSGSDRDRLEFFRYKLLHEVPTKAEAKSVLNILAKYEPLTTEVMKMIQNIFLN